MNKLTRKKCGLCEADALRTARKFVADLNRRNAVKADALKEHSEYRLIKIRYPQGANPMPVPSRRELMDRIKELESENEDLQTQIDEIAEIVTPEEEDEGEE